MAKEKFPQIEAICFNCERAVRIEGSDMCVCSKKGIVESGKTCSAFKADLLKYVPSRPNVPAIEENG